MAVAVPALPSKTGLPLDQSLAAAEEVLCSGAAAGTIDVEKDLLVFGSAAALDPRVAASARATEAEKIKAALDDLLAAGYSADLLSLELHLQNRAATVKALLANEIQLRQTLPTS